MTGFIFDRNQDLVNEATDSLMRQEEIEPMMLEYGLINHTISKLNTFERIPREEYCLSDQCMGKTTDEGLSQHQHYPSFSFNSSLNNTMNSSGYESGNDISFEPEQQQHHSKVVKSQFSVYNGINTIYNNQQLQEDSKELYYARTIFTHPPEQHSTLTVDSNEDVEFSYDQEETRDSFNSSESVQHRVSRKKRRILSKDQRTEANQRERRRMETMNSAYANLREILPHKNGRKRRKMSRIDIVVGAIDYIHKLETLLDD
ncbi:unnamed protein product [Didymodactylos carnosus]|uniref:BHLH domain-containing protein n=1 Tax=Didymodactylos carnosus TaxID=1234261 RepID=A0A8S2RBG5_9BILA|nr:unnamed protein product [Didymodactylos carnosus]CAF4153371.1 unnamed protein product [Didymodactylos carnosus]